MLSLPGMSKIQLPEPPFPHLLQSNTSPTDLEETEILKTISMVESQALQLQEIIQDHSLDSLDQPYGARQFVHAHRGVLSAIQRIPPEILQEIFFQTIPSWEDWDSWPRDTIPWILAQVCQQWREIALSTTSLWSILPRIYIDEKRPRSYVAQINELLVRSRDAPISFFLFTLSSDLESHPIIDALTRRSDRWQTVAIITTNLNILAFKGVKGRLSSLRTLSLIIHYRTGPLVFDMFEDAPRLREVRFNGDFPGEIRLPFSQLTHYKERARRRGMVDHTISLSASLTTLEITRYLESPEIPVTTLPFLNTLKVKFDFFRHGFLDRLTLPVIQEIWITRHSANLIADIIDIISRSHSPCILKKLVFRISGRRKMDSGGLTRLLRLTPDLVFLNTPLPPLEDLANLMIGENSPPLVPLLQKLIIDARHIRRPETCQLLNAIAVSRCSLQDSLMSTVPHLQVDRQGLKELRITFDGDTAWPHLKYLEGWVPSEEFEQLVIWKEKLLKHFSDLHGRGSPAPIQKRKPDWRCERVFRIFSDIEEFDAKNVNDIYISELYLILTYFTDLPVYHFISQVGIADRAAEILENWDPLFESHLNERRWVTKDEVSLIYLPIDDPLRLSANALDIVYGVEEDFSEMFWTRM